MKEIQLFPKNEKEAILIQEKLFSLGFAWPLSSDNVRNVDACVENGICVDEFGVIYHTPPPDCNYKTVTIDEL